MPRGQRQRGRGCAWGPSGPQSMLQQPRRACVCKRSLQIAIIPLCESQTDESQVYTTDPRADTSALHHLRLVVRNSPSPSEGADPPLASLPPAELAPCTAAAGLAGRPSGLAPSASMGNPPRGRGPPSGSPSGPFPASNGRPGLDRPPPPAASLESTACTAEGGAKEGGAGRDAALPLRADETDASRAESPAVDDAPRSAEDDAAVAPPSALARFASPVAVGAPSPPRWFALSFRVRDAAAAAAAAPSPPAAAGNCCWWLCAACAAPPATRAAWSAFRTSSSCPVTRLMRGRLRAQRCVWCVYVSFRTARALFQRAVRGG